MTKPKVPTPSEVRQAIKQMNGTRNKFGAIKSDCTFGHLHDSRKEAMRCEFLHFREKAGEISELVLQPEYSIQVNGIEVCKMVPDFEYMEDGEFITEDTKSIATRTRVYMLKRKLFFACFGRKIRET